MPHSHGSQAFAVCRCATILRADFAITHPIDTTWQEKIFPPTMKLYTESSKKQIYFFKNRINPCE